MQRAVDPAAVGVIHDHFGTKVVGQSDRHQVPRKRDSGPERHGAEIFMVPVLRHPGLVGRERRCGQSNRIGVGRAVQELPILPIVVEPDQVVVDDRGGVHAVIHRGRPHKRLKSGAGLALRLSHAVKLRFFELPAAHQGPDLAGSGVERHQRPLHFGGRRREIEDRLFGFLGGGQRQAQFSLFFLVELRQILLHHLFGGPLHLEIEGGVDRKAPLIEGIVAVLGIQDLPEIIHKIGAHRRNERSFFRADRHLIGFGFFPSQDVPGLAHPRKHPGTPALGAFGIQKRRIGLGRSREASEQGALGQIQLFGVLAEKCPRGRFHAVGAVAEIDLVHIHLENFFLRVVALQLQRQEELADFARQRLLLGKEKDFGKLLRNGRAAFDDAPMAEVCDHGQSGRRLHRQTEQIRFYPARTFR